MVYTNTAVRATEASNPHEACKAEVETFAHIGDKWTVDATRLTPDFNTIANFGKDIRATSGW